MLCSIPKKFHMPLVSVPADCVLDLHPWCLNQVFVYSLINSPLHPHINSPDNCSSNNSAKRVQRYQVSLCAHQGQQQKPAQSAVRKTDNKPTPALMPKYPTLSFHGGLSKHTCLKWADPLNLFLFYFYFFQIQSGLWGRGVDGGIESLLSVLGGNECMVCCGWVKNDLFFINRMVVCSSISVSFKCYNKGQ